MSQARKLRNEMEKTFKSISEHIVLFDEAYELFDMSETQQQEDKFQNEMKLQLRKLQKLRDLVKRWASSGSNMREKDRLLEARRTVEERMEAFKSLERGLKAKNKSRSRSLHSKKLSEQEEKKQECFEWLTELRDELERLRDQLRIDLDALVSKYSKKPAKRRKKSKRRRHHQTAEVEMPSELSMEKLLLEERIDRHTRHIDMLELIMRVQQNDELESEFIMETIQEKLAIFMEENAEPDFDFIEDDGIYDPLELERFQSKRLMSAKRGSKEPVREEEVPEPKIEVHKKEPAPKKDRRDDDEKKEELAPKKEQKKPPIVPVIPDEPITRQRSMSTMSNTSHTSSSSIASSSTPSLAEQITTPKTNFNESSTLAKHLAKLKTPTIQRKKVDHSSKREEVLGVLSQAKQHKLSISDEVSLLFHTPSNPAPVPDCFPTSSVSVIDSKGIRTAKTESLLFRSFTETGYSQHRVIKELKKREWAFNSEFRTFFKREDSTEKASNVYTGSIYFFNCENSFKIDHKENFNFFYSHLLPL
ncbi:hypothetical protein PCE1_003666 [Barthelona sp. PCE]